MDLRADKSNGFLPVKAGAWKSQPSYFVWGDWERQGSTNARDWQIFLIANFAEPMGSTINLSGTHTAHGSYSADKKSTYATDPVALTLKLIG